MAVNYSAGASSGQKKQPSVVLIFELAFNETKTHAAWAAALICGEKKKFLSGQLGNEALSKKIVAAIRDVFVVLTNPSSIKLISSSRFVIEGFSQAKTAMAKGGLAAAKGWASACEAASQHATEFQLVESDDFAIPGRLAVANLAEQQRDDMMDALRNGSVSSSENESPKNESPAVETPAENQVQSETPEVATQTPAQAEETKPRTEVAATVVNLACVASANERRAAPTSDAELLQLRQQVKALRLLLQECLPVVSAGLPVAFYEQFAPGALALRVREAIEVENSVSEPVSAKIAACN